MIRNRRKSGTILAAAGLALLLAAGGCGSPRESDGPVQTKGEPLVIESAAETEAASLASEGAETTAAAPAGTTGQEEPFQLVSWLKEIEKESAVLEEQLSSAQGQSEMTQASGERYKLWDGRLNELWGRLGSVLSAEEMDELTREEREWIALKDARAKEAAAFYEGGTLYSMTMTQEGAKLTRLRVYELADYLGKKTGRAWEDHFSGAYRSGPDGADAYLKYLGAGAYDLEAGLADGYGGLEAVAWAEGENLAFEDWREGVKGVVSPAGEGLRLTVSESQNERIAAGGAFVFEEKCSYPDSLSFKDISGWEFCFSSGAGAWRTVLSIDESGAFEGEYLDSDVSEEYVCSFSGTLSAPRQVDAYTWSVTVQSLALSREPGTWEEVDGIIRHYEEPYGLDEAGELYLYVPGTPKSIFSDQVLMWIGSSGDLAGHKLLPFYALYNVNSGQGFYSRPKTE